MPGVLCPDDGAAELGAGVTRTPGDPLGVRQSTATEYQRGRAEGPGLEDDSVARGDERLADVSVLERPGASIPWVLRGRASA